MIEERLMTEAQIAQLTSARMSALDRLEATLPKATPPLPPPICPHCKEPGKSYALLYYVETLGEYRHVVWGGDNYYLCSGEISEMHRDGVAPREREREREERLEVEMMT